MRHTYDAHYSMQYKHIPFVDGPEQAMRDAVVGFGFPARQTDGRIEPTPTSECPSMALYALRPNWAGIYSVLAGIISHATTALARDRPAQIKITVRNPNRNAREIDARITAVVSASRPEGKSRPASLISFD